jgi:hypothetical protein
MKRTKNLATALALSLLVAACGAVEGDGGEGQPCRPDGTCDPGLTCKSDICEMGMFTKLHNSTSFQKCAECHAPGAPGFVDGTETTQDWSSRDNAYQGLQGKAAGLIGNFEDCNGVPLIGNSPETSLIVAVFDETVRAAFSATGFSDCTGDAISDMTLKIGGALDAAKLTLLKDWITAGAP